MEAVEAGEGPSQPNTNDQQYAMMLSDVKVEIVETDEEDVFDTMDFLELAATASQDVAAEPIDFNSSDAITNPKTGLLVCLHCFEDIENNSLYDHMVNNHGYRKINWRCFICNEQFKDRYTLYQHKQTCKVQPKKKIRKTWKQIRKEVELLIENTMLDTINCPVCILEVDKEFIMEHLNEHTNAESIACGRCNRAFKSKLTLREHIKLVHLSVLETEECEICGQKFRSQKYLSNHKRNVHPKGNKEHKCKFCGKIFKSRLCVHQHQKYVHPPESVSVACSYCEKIFKSRAHLNQHLKVSHGVRNVAI